MRLADRSETDCIKTAALWPSLASAIKASQETMPGRPPSDAGRACNDAQMQDGLRRGHRCAGGQSLKALTAVAQPGVEDIKAVFIGCICH